MPWLLLAQPYDDTIPGIRSLYFSDVGFTTTPAESPANTYWDRRIEVPLVVTQSLFALANAGGRSDISIGEITLANQDGGLDALGAYDWDGRLIELRYTPILRPVLADFVVVFSGTAERVVVGDQVEIEVRDLQILLDQPYQPNRFAGTGGVEGPADLAGRRKPKNIGVTRFISPVLIDQSNRVWAYHDGVVQGGITVRDAGISLTIFANYANYAALIGAAIPAGQVGTCHALGLIRLGSAPAGVLVMEAEGASVGGVGIRRYGDLAQYVITSATSLTAGDFATGTVAAINGTAGQPLGFYYDGSNEITVRQVLDQLAQSVGCWFGFDDARKIVLGRLDAPAVTPDFSFTARDLFDLRPLATERRLKAQVVRFFRKWRPLQNQEIAAGITVGREWFAQEWSIERAEDAAVATASLLSREETLDSCLDVRADAAAEASRRVTLYGARRLSFEARVPLVAGVRPGVTVQITDPRFGLAGGRRFRVLRVERRAADQEMTLEVWG